MVEEGAKKVEAHRLADGAGIRIRRMIGSEEAQEAAIRSDDN